MTKSSLGLWNMDMVVLAEVYQREKIRKAIQTLSQFLKGVLASGLSEDTLESSAALDYCSKKGWLQAELLRDARPIPILCWAVVTARRRSKAECSRVTMRLFFPMVFV